MKYDEKYDADLVFSTDQEQDDSYEGRREHAKAVFRQINEKQESEKKDPEEAFDQAIKRIASVMLKIFAVFLVLFGSIIVPPLIIKDYTSFNVTTCCFLISLGVATMPFMGWFEIGEYKTFDKLSGRVASFIIMAWGVLTLFLPKLMPYKDSEAKVFTFGIAILAFSIVCVEKIIMVLTEKDRIYTKVIPNARCVGYVRSQYTTHDHDTPVHTHHHWLTSPVFEYEENGETKKVIYDRLQSSPDSQIPLNSVMEIRLSEKDEGSVQSPVSDRVRRYVIAGIIITAIAVFCIYSAAAGHVQGSHIVF